MSPGIRRFLNLALVAACVALIYGTWTAALGWIEPPRLVVPMSVTESARAQLYFDRGDGLREQDSSVRVVRPSTELVNVAFPVPRACLKQLRFDPMSGSGPFTLGQPQLTDSSGHVLATITFADITPTHEIGHLRLENGKLSGATTPGASDPQIEFTLRTPLCIEGVRTPWIEGLVVLALLVARRFVRPRGRAVFSTLGMAAS